MSRMAVNTESISSALGLGRWERCVAMSAFRAARSTIYVGLEGGTAMLRWQMAQAWSHAMEWDKGRLQKVVIGCVPFNEHMQMFTM